MRWKYLKPKDLCYEINLRFDAKFYNNMAVLIGNEENLQ